MSTADRETWDERYRRRELAAAGELADPCRFFVEQAAHWPREGRALDIAGGAGRNALWLASRGLAVTLADVSPVGLALAASTARRRGLALTTIATDLEVSALPIGPFALVICSHYLNRARLREVREILGPGGVFAMTHPTIVNLERHPRPSARFLLAEGELATLCVDLRSLYYREGWNLDGRHEAEIIASRPD